MFNVPEPAFVHSSIVHWSLHLVKAYFAALKPERTFFNVMTAAAGFLFACQWHIDWALFVATIFGTTLVVASACAVNNVTDRKLDTRMPRTQKRATATGQVSAKVLTALAVVLGVVGITLLVAYVNILTAVLGLIGYIDYVILYGWSKRHTPYSTLIGTVSGSMPLVAGYTAVTGQFDLTALLLGLVMLCWQMVHFYSIAIFRRKDYAAGDIPVWSVAHGVRSTQQWILVYTALYLFSIIGLTVWGDAGWLFAVVIGGMGLYWLWRGISGFKAEKPEKWAGGMFGFSLVTLMILSPVLTVSPLL